MNTVRIAVVVLLVAAVALFAMAQRPAKPAPKSQTEHQHPALKASPDFERLRQLAGRWEGKTAQGTAVSTFQVTSDGSAVMNLLFPGTKDEMLTVFHPDGENIMGTHYCSMHNQPRFVATPSKDPKVLTFKFKDITNATPGSDGHIEGLVIRFIDADHHTEEWISTENGKQTKLVVQLTRKN